MPASEVTDALRVVFVGHAVQAHIITGRSVPALIAVHAERRVVLGVTQTTVVAVRISRTVGRIAVLLCNNITYTCFFNLIKNIIFIFFVYNIP